MYHNLFQSKYYIYTVSICLKASRETMLSTTMSHANRPTHDLLLRVLHVVAAFWSTCPSVNSCKICIKPISCLGVLFPPPLCLEKQQTPDDVNSCTGGVKTCYMTAKVCDKVGTNHTVLIVKTLHTCFRSTIQRGQFLEYRIAAKYLHKSVFQHWFKEGSRMKS